MIQPITIALAVAVGLSGNVRADDMGGAQTITMNPSGLSTSDMDSRISFIEQRLDASRNHAYRWQWGWMAGYGTGLVLQSVRAGISDDDEHQADYVVSAVKAAGGVARMYFMPHPVRNGADPIREMGGNSREAKARKLAKAEEMLLDSAKASDRRWSEKAHIANAVVNVAGGAIIWGLGSPSTALTSAVVGIAVGTANILSAPGAGSKDLQDYKANFGMGTAKRWDWKVVPTMGGAAVHVTF